MADKDNWKDEVDKKLDKAREKGDIPKDLYDLLKKLLKAAKTAGDFAKVLEKEGILAKLGSAKKLGMKAASVVIDIFVQLVEAGPCPWTAIIVARINKLIQDAMLDDDEKRVKALQKLKIKYSDVWQQCQRQAHGNDKPKDVNKARPEELRAAGVSLRLAKTIVKEAIDDPFQTPNEILRVPDVNQQTVSRILEAGFYFGFSGLEILQDRRRKKGVYLARK